MSIIYPHLLLRVRLKNRMKLLIFGIVASGKTTLAKRLSEEMHIPYFEGDCIAWGFPEEERYKRTDEEQLDTIKMIDEKMSWIVEGTYRKSQHILYDLADQIVFLDTPARKRYFRIIVRFIKQKLGLEKCNYKPTAEMLRHMFLWTKEFEKNRKMHEDRLIKYQEKVIRIKSAKELDGKLRR